MQQLPLFAEPIQIEKSLTHESFSHGGFCAENERVALERIYRPLLQETDEFNRQLVSFQANKTEILHNWIKYREGFSAALVEVLLRKFGVVSGDTVLDPFAGSCATLLVAQALGINATGIEILPNNHLAWQAKSRAYSYNLDELDRIRDLVRAETPPATEAPFPHLLITEGAFPAQTERDLMAYTRWTESWDVSTETRLLFRLAIMSILENVSYTRKDGQYLRWDGRSAKLRQSNERRTVKGQRVIEGIDKGELPSVRSELHRVLDKMRSDIANLQKQVPPPSVQKLLEGNTLYTLPTLADNQFAAVITSPPYANRYDYTRTYALELAYLGVGDEIFKLRQSLLSCTVENRPKLVELDAYYRSIGRSRDYEKIADIARNHPALAEVNGALRTRNQRGEINNSGVLSMVDQYFTELTFVYAELFRVCRSGARVAFVNDNVRYAGEIVPVDLLSTDLAARVGFEPVTIYVLPQRKGNSSQQMGKYGRVELRKSITIWRKP